MLKTTVKAGNWSDSSVWGSTPPTLGDQWKVTFPLLIDQSTGAGLSLCTTWQTKPTVASTGVGGSLPAGVYRCKIAAVGSTGSTTPSASSGSVTLAAGQVVRVTLPPLPPGATTWDIYLTNVGGAAGTEKLYATGKSSGTYDCVSSLWMNGLVSYSLANGQPNGDAITATAKITIADGVTLTLQDNLSTTADIEIDSSTAPSGIEFDPSSSPSGLAIQHIYFGTTTTQGIGKLVTRGTASSRSFIRTKAGSLGHGQIKAAEQTSTNGNVKLDLQWTRFSLLGDSTHPAIDCYNNTSYNQLLTDVVFDEDCSTLVLSGIAATGGFILTRVSFRQTSGMVISGHRETCCAFQVAADLITGIRTVTNCSFERLPPLLSRGGASYSDCYFDDIWDDLSTGPGGSANSDYTLDSCFCRKTMSGTPHGTDTGTSSGQATDCYLYVDNVSGDTVADLNPHGMSTQAVTTHERYQKRWTLEYNGDSDSGDLWKNATGTGYVYLQNGLYVPNAINKSSGTVYTFFGGTSPGYRLRVQHCTYIAGPYSLSTSEGGLQPANTLDEFSNNLIYSIDGTTSNRFAIMRSTGGSGSGDTLDALRADGAFNNTYWNLQNNGSAGTCYEIHCSTTPGTNDINLGNSLGADISLYGPKFIDPTRKFISWCSNVLGAIGTPAEIIRVGLDALKAISDTTSPNHISGLQMIDPGTWVRAGFSPRNMLIQGAASDDSDIGAIPGTW